MKRMTAAEFQRALDERGLEQLEFARLIGTTKGTIYQWASGKRPVPAWIRPYFHLLDFFVQSMEEWPPDADDL